MKKIKTIGLIAPSGDLRNSDEINQKILLLEKHFKVKKFYNENTSCKFLADTDENRIKYFEAAFSDDEVDLVLSVRGGYGAIRIVDKINYDLIKDCNKYYAASSDATIFLMALNKKTNVKCFHSLMVTNGFVENFEKNINIIENNIFDIELEVLRAGHISGILWGGNLSSIVSTLSCGNFLPDEDIILFLEDLSEPLYKIDKMIYEIYRCENLRKKIKGIIFGDFYLPDKEIMPLLEQYCELFSIPVFRNTNITHKKTNITLPFGKTVNL